MKLLTAAASLLTLARAGPTIKQNPAAEREAAVAHAIVQHSSECFFSHVGTEAAYEACARGTCAEVCGSNAGSEKCKELCGSQALALYQQLSETLLASPGPVTQGPAVEFDAAAAYQESKDLSACLASHLGQQTALKDCSHRLCLRKCGSGDAACQVSCNRRAGVLVQRSRERPSGNAGMQRQTLPHLNPVVKRDPAAEQAVAAARQQVEEFSGCFNNNIVDSTTYRQCFQRLCFQRCGAGNGACYSSCSTRAKAALLLQRGPSHIKEDPAAASAAAQAHERMRRSFSCVLNHLGDEAKIKGCTLQQCFQECEEHDQGCRDSCIKRASALFQKSGEPRKQSFLQRLRSGEQP